MTKLAGLEKLIATAAIIAMAEIVKVGPHGYIHGWIYVGPAGELGHLIHHPEHGAGTVVAHDKHSVDVKFGHGTETFAVTHAKQGPKLVKTGSTEGKTHIANVKATKTKTGGLNAHVITNKDDGKKIGTVWEGSGPKAGSWNFASDASGKNGDWYTSQHQAVKALVAHHNDYAEKQLDSKAQEFADQINGVKKPANDFKPGDKVQYYSVTKKAWMPATYVGPAAGSSNVHRVKNDITGVEALVGTSNLKPSDHTTSLAPDAGTSFNLPSGYHQEGNDVVHTSSGEVIGSVTPQKLGTYSYHHNLSGQDEGNFATPANAAMGLIDTHQDLTPPPLEPLEPSPEFKSPALTDMAAWDAVKNPGNLTVSEQLALEKYGTKAYKTINPYLHHDKHVFNTDTMQYEPATAVQALQAENTIKALDSVFTKAIPLEHSIVVHRGTGDGEKMLGPVGSKVGKTFSNKAYTSTTTVGAAKVGYGYGYESKDTKFEITVPAGSKVIRANDHEHEVLLPRDANFKVISDTKDTQGIRHVKLEYLPNGAGSEGAPSAPSTPKPAGTYALGDKVTYTNPINGAKHQAEIVGGPHKLTPSHTNYDVKYGSEGTVVQTHDVNLSAPDAAAIESKPAGKFKAGDKVTYETATGGAATAEIVDGPFDSVAGTPLYTVKLPSGYTSTLAENDMVPAKPKVPDAGSLKTSDVYHKTLPYGSQFEHEYTKNGDPTQVLGYSKLEGGAFSVHDKNGNKIGEASNLEGIKSMLVAHHNAENAPAVVPANVPTTAVPSDAKPLGTLDPGNILGTGSSMPGFDYVFRTAKYASPVDEKVVLGYSKHNSNLGTHEVFDHQGNKIGEAETYGQIKALLTEHVNAQNYSVKPNGTLAGGMPVVKPKTPYESGHLTMEHVKVKKNGEVRTQEGNHLVGHVAKTGVTGYWTSRDASGQALSSYHKSRSDAVYRVITNHNKNVSSNVAAAATPKPAAPLPPPLDAGHLKGQAAYSHVSRAPLPDENVKNAVYHYTGSGYRQINEYLRKGTIDGNFPTDKQDQRYAELTKNLDRAFTVAHPTTEPIITYRGFSHASDIVGEQGKSIGRVFRDNGFVSSSTSEGEAKGFGGAHDHVLMHVHIPAGSRVLKPGDDGAQGHQENEILLPRGSRFKILSDEKVGDPYHPYRLMHVELVK